MTVYYPRRTDGVYGYQFDGSRTAAEDISDVLKGSVQIVINPGRVLELRIDGYESVVKPGEVVVVDADRKIVEVIDSWDFKGKYSKDGL